MTLRKEKYNNQIDFNDKIEEKLVRCIKMTWAWTDFVTGICNFLFNNIQTRQFVPSWPYLVDPRTHYICFNWIIQKNYVHLHEYFEKIYVHLHEYLNPTDHFLPVLFNKFNHFQKGKLNIQHFKSFNFAYNDLTSLTQTLFFKVDKWWELIHLVWLCLSKRKPCL